MTMGDESQLTEAKRKLLEQMRGGVRASATPAQSKTKRFPRDTPTPLSLAQEQVWRLDQDAAKLAPLHNESITIHREGSCEPSVMERSLAEIVRRHEIWRTTYEVQSGEPVQMVHPAVAFRLPVDDLRHIPEDEREAAAAALGSEDARGPFDLTRGPLFRARLVTLREDQHRLYLTAHQSIVDGISVFDVFPFELSTLYEAFVSGRPSPLPELENQFGDFASWQRRNFVSGCMENQVAYWEKQLGGDLPVLQWPKRRGERPAGQRYHAAMQSFEFPTGLSDGLKNVGRREGATLFMVMLAALVSLLHAYTGQEDIIVGTLSPSGRKHTEWQRLLGYFLNPVALRANLRDKPSFPSLLLQIRELTLGAISHDDVPLELMAERLGLARDPSRHSFFTVALSVAPDVAPLPPGWKMTYMDVESGGGRWDLYIEMSDRAEGLLGRAQYNPDLFSRDQINEVLKDYRVRLEEIAAPATSSS
jgi:hypothetical protein